MLSHIHHINFLVRDLDKAVQQYQKVLGLSGFELDQLEGRAVRTAKVKLGESWLVLVQPLNQDSVPARHLKEHGEGFFLLSFGTDNLDDTLRQIAENGGELEPTGVRAGLDNWRVADLKSEPFYGVQLQITEEQAE